MLRAAMVACLVAVAARAQYKLSTIAGGGFPNNAPALSVSFTPRSIAAGPAGILYIADRTTVYQLTASGRISVYASSFSSIAGMAVDAAGNLYVSDAYDNWIQRIAAGTSIARTVAGGGGFTKDGVPAIQAQIEGAAGIAVDGAGNLYIAESWGQRVRKVDASTGLITTIAGTGTAGYSGDGGPALAAQFNGPLVLTCDATGNVYVFEAYNYRIRRIDAASHGIDTVAGNGSFGFSGDGGSPTSASLSASVSAMALDSSGNLYVADSGNHVVRKIAADRSTIVSIAGAGVAGYSGDGGPASQAQLNSPAGLAIDQAGNIDIADAANNRVRAISAQDQIITTISGGGSAGDGGPAIAAQLNGPSALAVDEAGNLYINDCGEMRVRRVALSTGTITTFAGAGYPGFSGDSGPATEAALQGCGGLAAASGSIYIADSQNYRVRAISPGGAINTLVGDGQPGSLSTPTLAAAAQFHPTAVSVDASGDVYVADAVANRVLKDSNATGIVSLIAGDGSFGFAGDEGLASRARLASPSSVAVDAAGNLYIADTANQRIRMVDAQSHTISTIAGTGNYSHSGDGYQAEFADIAFPSNLVFDVSGNLYFLESTLGDVRRIGPSGIITTLASGLTYPGGLAVDAAGNLYVSEPTLNRVIKLTPPSGPLQIASASALPEAFVGASYLYAIAATGGAGPYRNWNVLAGTLPSGLVLDPITGLLHGTPSEAGYFEFTVAVGDSTGTRVYKIFKLTVTAPQFLIAAEAVVNGASLAPGPVSPGEIVAIFGAGFGPAGLTVAAPDASGSFPTKLNGVRVLFDNVPAPLLYVSATQAGAVVPYGVSGKGATKIQVESNGGLSSAVSLPVAPLRPAAFTADASGAGQVLAINEDGTLNSADHAASAGSILVLYATGFGVLSPATRDGALSKPPLGSPAGRVAISIGGAPAELAYAGAAPSMISGLIQINVRVPAGTRPGSQPLSLSVGGIFSSQMLSVAVR